MPEIAGDAVEYFDPGDALSICRAIERLLTDERRSTELSERGLRQAANFSWARCGERLAEILNEAAK
ncbi:MAG: glycosyltransferase family 1 protein, partial [Rhodospirillales bacterium]|nr:glycosyltransferase family 1 protein [Rhodospirillales bacterium]